MRPIAITSGLSTSSDAAGSNVSTLQNWRMDSNGVNVPRPAFTVHDMTGINADTTIIGCVEYAGDLIMVGSDRWIYRVSYTSPNIAIPLSVSGDATTTLGGTARPVFARDPTDLFIAGGGRISRVTSGAPTASRFTTGPENATHIAGLGQRLVANDATNSTTRQQFFWSDLGDGNDSTWNALSFATAEARPDEVVGVFENTQELFIFGESTIQVYSVGVDPLNPWDTVNTINVGLGAAYSVFRYDNTFAFIDENSRIVMTDGHASSVKDMSRDIITTLRGFDVTDAIGWRERDGRYDLYCWIFPTGGICLEYNPETKTWAERAYYDSVTLLQGPPPLSCHEYWSELGIHVYGRTDTNGLATLSDTAGLDFGDTRLCRRVTGYSDYGTNAAKRSRRIRAVARRGTSGPSGTPDAIEVRVQDDGRPWTSWKPISVGNDGDDHQTVDLHFGGVFNRRRVEIRYSGSDATSLVSLSDDVEALRD